MPLDEVLLKHFDEIVVVKAEKIVEKGSYSELMEQKEYFYSLYTICTM